MANVNKSIDWPKIERLYRAGLLSIAEIAKECKTVESNIRYRAKKEGWKRDLSQEVRNLTRTKLVENLAQVYKEGEDRIKELSDGQIVEEAARTQVEVVRQHQQTLMQGHGLTLRMLDELDATTSRQEELEALITSSEDAKRRQGLMRAVSLQARAQVMRDLANAARVWVTMERQAFNIADDRNTKENNKVEEMTAEQLRSEILEDAKKLGLDVQLNRNTKVH